MAVQADVTDGRAVASMVASVGEGLGPVDIFVNNAGITQYVPFPHLRAVTAGIWRRQDRECRLQLSFHRRGHFHPLRRVQGGAGVAHPVPGQALAPAVQVNVVASGWMLTEWIDRYVPPDRAEEIRAGGVPLVPVEDVVRSVMGLVTNDSVTGATAVVDRGEMLG